MAFSDILKPEMLRLILFIFIFIMLDIYINPPYRHDEVLGGSYYGCTEDPKSGNFECVRTAEFPPPPLGISFGLGGVAANLFWSYIIRALSAFLAYFVSSFIIWGLYRSVWMGIS